MNQKVELKKSASSSLSLPRYNISNCPGCSGPLDADDGLSSNICHLYDRSWHKNCFEKLHPEVTSSALRESSSSSNSKSDKIEDEKIINTYVPPANATTNNRRRRRRQRNQEEADGNEGLPFSSFPISLPLTVLDVNPHHQRTQLRNDLDIESAAKIIHELETNTKRRVEVQLLNSRLVPSLAFFSFSLEGVLHRCLAMGLVRDRPYRFRMVPGTIIARELVSFCIETGQVATRADAVRLGNYLVEAGLLLSLMPIETKEVIVSGGILNNSSQGDINPLSSSSSSSSSMASAPSPVPSKPPGPPGTSMMADAVSLEANPTPTPTSSTSLSSSSSSSVPVSLISTTPPPFQDKDGLLFVVNLRSRGSLRDAVISQATQTSIPTNRRRKSQISSGGSGTGLPPLSPSVLHSNSLSSSSSSAIFATPLATSTSASALDKTLSAVDVNVTTKCLESTSADNVGIIGLSPDFNFGIGSLPQSNYGGLLSSLPLNGGGVNSDLAPLIDRTLSPRSGSYRASVSEELLSSPLIPAAIAVDPESGLARSTSGDAQLEMKATTIPTSLSQSSIYRDRVRSRLDSNASWEVRLQNNAATFSETSDLMLAANNTNNIENAVSPSFSINDASTEANTAKDETIYPVQLTPSTRRESVLLKKTEPLLYSTPSARTGVNENNSVSISKSNNDINTNGPSNMALPPTGGDSASALLSTPKTSSVLEFAVARIASAVFSGRSSRIRQQPGIAATSVDVNPNNGNGSGVVSTGRKLLFGLGATGSSSSSSSSSSATATAAAVPTSASTSILSSALASVSLSSSSSSSSSSLLPPPTPISTARRSASSMILNIGGAKDDPLADSDSDSDFTPTPHEGEVDANGNGVSGSVDLRDREVSNDNVNFNDGKVLETSLLLSTSASSQRISQRGTSVEALDRRRRAAGLAAGKSDFQIEKDRQAGLISSSSPDFSGETVLLQPLVSTLLPPLSLPSTPAGLRDRRKALVARRNELTSTQWMSGWLVKQGHIRKSWKRRWFVLTGDVLVYFKTQVKSSQVTELRARGGVGGSGGGGGASSSSLLMMDTLQPLLTSSAKPSLKPSATASSGSSLASGQPLQTPAGTIGIKDFTLERASADRFPKPFGMRLASKSTVTLEYLFFAEDEASYNDWSAALLEALKAWEELEADIGILQQAQSAAALEIVASDARQWGGVGGTSRRRNF